MSTVNWTNEEQLSHLKRWRPAWTRTRDLRPKRLPIPQYFNARLDFSSDHTPLSPLQNSTPSKCRVRAMRRSMTVEARLMPALDPPPREQYSKALKKRKRGSHQEGADLPRPAYFAFDGKLRVTDHLVALHHYHQRSCRSRQRNPQISTQVDTPSALKIDLLHPSLTLDYLRPSGVNHLRRTATIF